MTATPIDLVHMQRAKLAFERTSVFEDDVRIRTTHNRADLIAISDSRAAAVILKRRPSQNIVAAVSAGLPKIEDDLLSSRWTRGEGLLSSDVARIIPDVIKEEIPELIAIQDTACNREIRDSASIIFFYQDGSGTCSNGLEFYAPHYDYAPRYDIPRLVTTYTDEPELTTEVFTGMISSDTYERLVSEYSAACKAYPNDLKKIDAVKDGYKRHRIGAYDIALLNGPSLENPTSILRAAIHAPPLPQKGKQRLAVTIT